MSSFDGETLKHLGKEFISKERVRDAIKKARTALGTTFDDTGIDSFAWYSSLDIVEKELGFVEKKRGG